MTLLERRARVCPQASLAAYCNASANIAHPFSNGSQRLSPVFADVPAAARNQSQQQWPSTVRDFNSYARADTDGSQGKVERRTDLTEKEVSTRAPSKTSADARNSSAKAVKVKPASFYGSYGISKLILVDQRVARLYANVQQRLLSQEQAPFEHFALQRQAFAWAEAHELAKDLKYVFGRICEMLHACKGMRCLYAVHVVICAVLYCSTPCVYHLQHSKPCTACRVFSYEHNSTGKRSFLVTTYTKFWQRYQDMLPDHRHHYEIIQEHAPCHLYFGEVPRLAA